MQSHTFDIPEVNTQAEVDYIVTAVRSYPGVITFEGDEQTKLFTITWNEPATLQDVSNIIQGLGFTPAMK
jgi:hypothetical protein